MELCFSQMQVTDIDIFSLEKGVIREFFSKFENKKQ